MFNPLAFNGEPSKITCMYDAPNDSVSLICVNAIVFDERST